MSEAEQETAATEIGTPAVPGHHGGPPKTGTKKPGSDRPADEVAAGHPDKVEPHAGLDK